jgi:hypothetical protein
MSRVVSPPDSPGSPGEQRKKEKKLLRDLNSRLEAILRDVRLENHRLSREIDSLVEKSKTQEDTIASLVSVKEELNLSVRAVQTEVAQLDDKRSKDVKATQELQKELQRIKDDGRIRTDKLKEEIHKISLELMETERRRPGAIAEKGRLTTINEQLQAALTWVESSKSKAEEGHINLTAQIHELQAKLSRCERDIELLMKRLAEYRNDNLDVEYQRLFQQEIDQHEAELQKRVKRDIEDEERKQKALHNEKASSIPVVMGQVVGAGVGVGMDGVAKEKDRLGEEAAQLEAMLHSLANSAARIQGDIVKKDEYLHSLQAEFYKHVEEKEKVKKVNAQFGGELEVLQRKEAELGKGIEQILKEISIQEAAGNAEKHAKEAQLQALKDAFEKAQFLLDCTRGPLKEELEEYMDILSQAESRFRAGQSHQQLQSQPQTQSHGHSARATSLGFQFMSPQGLIGEDMTSPPPSPYTATTNTAATAPSTSGTSATSKSTTISSNTTSSISTKSTAVSIGPAPPTPQQRHDSGTPHPAKKKKVLKVRPSALPALNTGGSTSSSTTPAAKKRKTMDQPTTTGAPVRIISINPLLEEVVLQNCSSNKVDLHGWKLVNMNYNFSQALPRATLGPQETFKLVPRPEGSTSSKPPSPSSRMAYWDKGGRDVQWPMEGYRASLKDPSGNTVHVYAAHGEG